MIRHPFPEWSPPTEKEVINKLRSLKRKGYRGFKHWNVSFYVTELNDRKKLEKKMKKYLL